MDRPDRVITDSPPRARKREETSTVREETAGGCSGKKMEAPPGFEPGNKGFADPCLTTWLWRPITKSGKRDSNSRQPPWQGGALPTELFPLST